MRESARVLTSAPRGRVVGVLSRQFAQAAVVHDGELAVRAEDLARPRGLADLGELQTIAQRRCFAGQPLDYALAIRRFVRLYVLTDIVGAMLQEPVYQLRQLVRRRYDRLGRPGPRLYAAIERPQHVLRVVTR